MLWKTNFIEQNNLNTSTDSMPGDAHVNCINDENQAGDEADDEQEVKYCADNSKLLNARQSDQYELSDGDNPNVSIQ